jgi:acylphosphatase
MVKHLSIRGKVQGVGYRYHYSREAERLGITGWVRNRRDGSVEAMLAGTPQAVDALVAWARLGPSSAVVEHVDVTEAQGEYTGFSVLPTA